MKQRKLALVELPSFDSTRRFTGESSRTRDSDGTFMLDVDEHDRE
jgi:hypothetical protein